jgi:hypothetical protein
MRRGTTIIAGALAAAAVAVLLARGGDEQRAPDTFEENAQRVENAAMLEGSGPATPATEPGKTHERGPPAGTSPTAAGKMAPAHEGEFAFHYKQGYSFLEQRVVEQDEIVQADLVFESCAGGISSVTLSVPAGKLAHAARVTDLQGKDTPGAGRLLPALLRGHVKDLDLQTRKDGRSRSPASDVFLVRTSRGEWVKLAILARAEHAPGGWTKQEVSIAYSLNPDAPEFIEGVGDIVEAGFEFDTRLIPEEEHPVLLRAQEEKEKRAAPFRAEIAALDARAERIGAGLPSGHKIAAVMVRRHADALGSEDPYTAATFSFEHDTRDDRAKTRNDWDFVVGNRGPDSPDELNIRTVTDDRGQIWDLGVTSFNAALRGDVPMSEGATRATVKPGHVYLVHTLDSESDYWVLFKVLEARPGRDLIIEWVKVDDPTRLRAALESADKDLRSPSAWLQLHSQHGGGNAHRVFLDGTKNAYVGELSETPLALKTKQRGRRLRGAGYVEGGLIPLGQTFLVETLDIVMHLDDGRVRSRVQVGPYAVLTAMTKDADQIVLYTIDRGREVIGREDLPIQRSISVQIPLSRDEEKNVYVEGASFTRNDVRLRGRFLRADDQPPSTAQWNARTLFQAQSALDALLVGSDLRNAARYLKDFEGHMAWATGLRRMAINGPYRAKLDALIDELAK